MRKCLFAMVLLVIIGTSVPSVGQFVNNGQATSTTVKAVLQNPVDDMWVTLRGHIIKKISREKYVFADSTGQIGIDVDDRYFPYGTPITPATLVEISGEIDKEFMSSPEVDVKKMIVVLPSGKDTSPSSGFQETE